MHEASWVALPEQAFQNSCLCQRLTQDASYLVLIAGLCGDPAPAPASGPKGRVKKSRECQQRCLSQLLKVPFSQSSKATKEQGTGKNKSMHCGMDQYVGTTRAL